MSATQPKLIVSFQKDLIPQHLCHAIADICLEALKKRDVFTIALSGGSLPKFLAEMNDIFEEKEADPQLSKWHVILADERCVPSSHDDSNLKALKDHLFSEKLKSVPESQIYGINEEKLDAGADDVATDYETIVSGVLGKSGGNLDVAVLGFGPDGHTCSLFPKHALLEETTKLVAGITDSPKPPPSRITLTLKVLNTMTRHVIFCGAGGSKGPIVRNAFISLDKSDDPYEIPGGALYKVTLENDPPPYPCTMVVPNTTDEGEETNTLTWIVDADAMNEANSSPSPY